MHWFTSVEGGPQRVNHAAISVGSKIYTFGGYNSDEAFEFSVKIDIHVFDTNELRWRPLHYINSEEAPKKCYGHTVVAFRSKIYLWGGRNNMSASNTLYCFDTESLMWNTVPVTGTIPKKVDGHSACVIGFYMYVFGGFEEESEMFTNAAYRLSLHTFEWERIRTKGQPPSSRDFHTASVIDNRMYIFGGRSAENEHSYDSQREIYDNNIMYLDTQSMSWEKPECSGKVPCGRRSHSAVVYNDEIYVIGGFDGDSRYHLNDIYKFNPATNVWSKMHPIGEPPCARRRHCTCVVGDQLFLFGGSSPRDEEEYANQYHNDAEDVGSFLLQLHDHSDTYILDFFSTLKRLCQMTIVKYMLRVDGLPQALKEEIKVLSPYTRSLKSFCTNYPRQDYPALGFSA